MDAIISALPESPRKHGSTFIDSPNNSQSKLSLRERIRKGVLGQSQHWELMQIGIADSALFKNLSNNTYDDSGQHFRRRGSSFSQNSSADLQLSKSFSSVTESIDQNDSEKRNFKRWPSYAQSDCSEDDNSVNSEPRYQSLSKRWSLVGRKEQNAVQMEVTDLSMLDRFETISTDTQETAEPKGLFKKKSRRWSLIGIKPEIDKALSKSMHSSSTTHSKRNLASANRIQQRRHSVANGQIMSMREEDSNETLQTRDTDSESDDENHVLFRQLLEGKQLERLSLDHFRQLKSTTNIDCKSTKATGIDGASKGNISQEIPPEQPSLRIRSLLLDSSGSLNTDKMEWRKELIVDRMIKRKLLQALYFLKYHNEEDVITEQEESKEETENEEKVKRRMSRRFSTPSLSKSFKLPKRRASTATCAVEPADDVSTAQTEISSVATTEITTSSYGIPGLRPMEAEKQEKKKSRRRSRQFLDLTKSDGERDDDDGDLFEQSPAIFLQRRRSSIAGFLDDVFNVDKLQKENVTDKERKDTTRQFRRQSLPSSKPRLDFRRQSFSSFRNLSVEEDNKKISRDEEANEGAEIELTMFSSSNKDDILPDKVDSGIENDDGDDDDDYDGNYEYMQWDKANTALVREVHSIANQLEEKLVECGHESPYSDIGLVLPSFKLLHHPIQKMAEEFASCTASEPDRVESQEVECPADSDEETKPFSEIAAEANQTSRHCITKDAFYARHSSGYSLPIGLATGLDKCLPESTIDEARDILGNLTAAIPSQAREVAQGREEMLMNFGETVSSFRSSEISENELR